MMRAVGIWRRNNCARPARESWPAVAAASRRSDGRWKPRRIAPYEHDRHREQSPKRAVETVFVHQPEHAAGILHAQMRLVENDTRVVADEPDQKRGIPVRREVLVGKDLGTRGEHNAAGAKGALDHYGSAFLVYVRCPVRGFSEE